MYSAPYTIDKVADLLLPYRFIDQSLLDFHMGSYLAN